MVKATAKAIRDLLDGQKVLSLAVIADGTPYAGLLPFVALRDYTGLLIHASRMAKHSRGLASGARITFNLGDFTLYRLEFASGLYVGGFGRASEFHPRDIGTLC